MMTPAQESSSAWRNGTCETHCDSGHWYLLDTDFNFYTNRINTLIPTQVIKDSQNQEE